MKLNLTTASLIFPIFILTALSLLTLHSVAPAFLSDQLLFAVLGFIIISILSRIDYHLYTFSSWPWYVLIIFLLLLTLIIGQANRETVRWITIGSFAIQTSEFVKPFLVLFAAIYLPQMPDSFKSILTYLALVGFPMFLILIQPNLGTTIILSFFAIISLIAVGTNFKKLTLLLLSLLILAPLSFNLLRPYQKDRLTAFINPESDALGSGYQTLQAVITVGSGQFFGRGLGQGTQSHLRFLPERYSDFIFASLVEEMGFLGGALLILCYLWLLFGFLRAARYADTDIAALICLLSLYFILFQFLVNIGMNMGLFPITGITLPFVSHGGSSYLSFSILIGLTLAIASRPMLTKPQIEIR